MKNNLTTAAKKRAILILLAMAAVGILAGCSSTPEDTTSVAPEAGNITEENDTSVPPLGGEVMAWLDDQVEGPVFSYGFNYIPLDTVDVYLPNGLSSQLVIQEKETGIVYEARFPFSDITTIRETGVEGQLALYTDGQVFEYDRIFYTGVTNVTIDYRTGEVVEYFAGAVDGTTLGFMQDGDSYAFSSCILEENVLIMEFECLGSAGLQSPCGEIRVQGPKDFDTGKRSFLFLDTEYTLEADLAALAGALEGVRAASVQVLDIGNFKGTMLDIECEEGHMLVCSFNEDGAPETYEGFRLTTVPTE